MEIGRKDARSGLVRPYASCQNLNRDLHCNHITPRTVKMATELRGKLVRIGNSRGVRLPRAVIEQAGLGEEVLISVRDHEVVIRAAVGPRASWEEALRRHGPPDEDSDQVRNSFDDEEWTW